MRILITTTPIRPVPTDFPPIGSLGILTYLRKQGFSDVEFYNIDGNRPSYDEALAHIIAAKPDIVGISAVVSTAYAYTKRLSLDLKKAMPDALIVVGGPMATSAEVLLRRTGVDLCVTGEGEITFFKIAERAKTTRNPKEFSDIPGLALIDRNDRVVNTGYEEQLSAEEIYDIRWEDLEAASDMDIFVTPMLDQAGRAANSFFDHPKTYEPHRRNKKHMILPASKGCVAKCTFCHRHTKGMRYIPVPRLMKTIDDMIERYDVGFINFGDENFGTDKRWLRNFCEEIKKYDVLWRVAGMRVNCLDVDSIRMMEDAGCVSILCGMETGSETILQVMEKKVRLRDNYNAMEWITNAGLRTAVQLVVGMPGESPETVDETARFAEFACSLDPQQCPTELSINYAQALPGTPLYEFGRRAGMIGTDLDGEEEYLLRVSDKDAHDEATTLNFTQYPKLLCETWRPLIQIRASRAYIRKFGELRYRQAVLERSGYFQRREDTGYVANPKRLVDRSGMSDSIHDVKSVEFNSGENPYPSLWSLVKQRKIGLAIICHPMFFYRLRFMLVLLIVLRHARYYGWRETWMKAKEYLTWRFTARTRPILGVKARSLRKIVADIGAMTNDNPEMELLRRGR